VRSPSILSAAITVGSFAWDIPSSPAMLGWHVFHTFDLHFPWAMSTQLNIWLLVDWLLCWKLWNGKVSVLLLVWGYFWYLVNAQ
jgi:hypothetical protein